MMVATKDRLAFGREEAAALIGISRPALDTLICDGAIAAIKSGSRTLVTRQELERYLKSLPAPVIKYPENERKRLAAKAAKRKAAGVL
jgi:excisionase family DNA binding protein